MPPKKKSAKKKLDRRFRAIHDKEVKWEEGAANKLLTLPKGVKVKIFAHDPVMKRIDMKVKFPKGYVEPVHTHKSWHSILVTKGRMCVAGKDLRPGDYVEIPAHARHRVTWTDPDQATVWLAIHYR